MEKLEIDGKDYVSARHAAREHGYVADYIGQLIRSGKLEGKKVGRAWYVEEASLAVYMGSSGTSASDLTQDVEPRAPKSGATISKEAPLPEKKVFAEDAPPQKPHQATASKSEAATAQLSGYPLMQYMADEEPVLPPLIESSAESKISLHRQETQQASTSEVAGAFSEASIPQGPQDSAFAEEVWEDKTYRHTQPKAIGRGKGGVVLVGAFAVVVLAIGVSSLIMEKEIEYSGASAITALKNL